MDVREGVVWHDGSPFTPKDVVWSLQRAGDPKTGSGRRVRTVSDIGMIFISNNKEMEDENVRLGAIHAIDKGVIAKGLLRGYATPIATLEACETVFATPKHDYTRALIDPFRPSVRTGFDETRPRRSQLDQRGRAPRPRTTPAAQLSRCRAARA